MKISVITGANGQDSSYLAELLLEKGYKVVGVVRRTAMEDKKLENIEHLLSHPNFKIENGDLTDSASIWRIVAQYKPDEFYNLAGQSHVGASFTTPVSTFEINATGVLHCLEAIRVLSPNTRFYQASTSEMFGANMNVPHNEDSNFIPNSPYACAKLAAHNLVANYRRAYGMHASCGILYNHECLTENTPVIVRDIRSSMIDILPISEIVPHRTSAVKQRKYSTISPCKYEVWDGNRWAKILTRTATWNDEKNDKKVIRVTSRGGLYEATRDHISFRKGSIETKTGDLKVNDELELKDLPDLNHHTEISESEAEFLGLMVAEGYCKESKARFTNKDPLLLERIKVLWNKISGGFTSQYSSISGFTGEKSITNITLSGNASYLKYVQSLIYTENGFKKIPKIILNASRPIIDSFMNGYLAGDGTKNFFGKDDYQSLTTNSSVLAAGLWFIYTKHFNRRITMQPEERGESIYYRININTDENTNRGKSHIKPLNQIKKITNINYCGWLYDLETDSGTFSAGVGLTWVHNSPRRGLQFVTRKITKAAARIKLGLQDNLELGNLDAKRDWGHAKEYCINKDVPILTTSGWKYFHEVKVGEQVINFDRKNNKITTDSVLKIHDAPSDGKRVHFTGIGTDFTCTYDHRLIYQNKSKKSKGGWSDYKFCTAKEYHDILNKSALRTKYDYRLPSFEGYDKEDYKGINDDEIYLLGALLAEGSLGSRRSQGIQVSISQSFIMNKKIHSKLVAIFQKLSLKYAEYNKNCGVTEWEFNADSSKRILERYFDSFDVHIMPKYVYQFSRRQFEILYESLMDCDGCWGGMSYASKRYLLAADFQTVAHLAGHRTSNIYKHKTTGGYVVKIMSHRHKYVYITNSELIETDQNEAWCVTTNNESLILRENNTINITGNCQAMWLMLQQDKAGDYVIATGETHSIKDFINYVGEAAGFDLMKHVVVTESNKRPSEVPLLLGDASKAKKVLGWQAKIKAKELAVIMYNHDLEREIKNAK